MGGYVPPAGVLPHLLYWLGHTFERLKTSKQT
jgi:hypothetical protein